MNIGKRLTGFLITKIRKSARKAAFFGNPHSFNYDPHKHRRYKNDLHCFKRLYELTTGNPWTDEACVPSKTKEVA